MRVSDFQQSRYFYASDFTETGTILTIDRVEVHEMESRWNGEGIQKVLVVFFEEDTRGQPLRGNQKEQAKNAFGNETDDWPGRKARLYSAPFVARDGTSQNQVKIEAGEDLYWRSGHFVRSPKPKR